MEDPMNEMRAESVRNVAVVSSAGAGKTSLIEAMLFTTGAIPNLGTVPQGNTVSDFEPEEIHRQISVSTSLLRCSWQQTTLNVIDPPGAQPARRTDDGTSGGRCCDRRRWDFWDPERTRESVGTRPGIATALSNFCQ